MMGLGFCFSFSFAIFLVLISNFSQLEFAKVAFVAYGNTFFMHVPWILKRNMNSLSVGFMSLC